MRRSQNHNCYVEEFRSTTFHPVRKKDIIKSSQPANIFFIYVKLDTCAMDYIFFMPHLLRTVFTLKTIFFFLMCLTLTQKKHNCR